MAPKGAFTLERIHGFAILAVERAQARLIDEGLVFSHLSCEYLGVAAADGSADPNAIATKRCSLVYEWRVCAAGVNEKSLVTVRCGHASVHWGVPFPDSWQTALKCQQLTSVAKSAAEEARAEIGREVDCMVVGVVKEPSSTSSDETVPGNILLLESGVARIPYILCALVSGSTWLCHRGSFDEGSLDRDNPLNEKDLVS
jgi:hypothetical protein